ncbi:hypothetical protein A2422_01835 [Candidatus Woesebacteria bacterium RIFOXYC1_FULL_31_51]|uniref:Uncharacterized protein n=1 Tax=Candidatus Woesebacteria bacterium GW2011_GWC2_31_9 TaxID=1618586 RepID=A0A0G0AZD4_9BACT|nr:MAG: hypothetical protein UR17_C0001G0823 [Candidatus Woesebacteria bacterium GW2011_GWF1_31_35]KKP23632.1 MAG: hypothetical protein UR11_C0001G0606 [Candidatus Woesebacteria bacterium GW2011_GWC1_30_29]KKP26987.1 MAG: hypothetical protein UR13_C0001G0082 [Candidatus Woesebacteria bacterium GW2011_GWD1_31_12]KKP31910.1 MAG: hypothetical protein UR21_C0004G0046 [Candidatus Woesebacteria bacterium GW2011_GWC2_31_9]KKP34053.1 MAG: hypothetical protein UR24_C0001G0118 [Candidatus Woesebacteria b
MSPILGNLLFLGFIVFSLFGFVNGIDVALRSPFHLIAGIFSILLLYFIFLLPRVNLSKFEIMKGGLFEKIKNNNQLRILMIIVLLILSLGNFVYANSWIGTSTTKGAEYVEAVILSILAFLLLKKNNK